jgi:hypothetical protein
MNRLIVETYTNSSINKILEDISKKYKIDTSKDKLQEDIDIQEVKFKYRTYQECLKILYKNLD